MFLCTHLFRTEIYKTNLKSMTNSSRVKNTLETCLPRKFLEEGSRRSATIVISRITSERVDQNESLIREEREKCIAT